MTPDLSSARERSSAGVLIGACIEPARSGANERTFDGAIPLSMTLDTACLVTRSVRDEVLLHEVLADRRVALAHPSIRALRFAVPTTPMLDGCARSWPCRRSGAMPVGPTIWGVAMRDDAVLAIGAALMQLAA